MPQENSELQRRVKRMNYNELTTEINRRRRAGESVDQMKKELGIGFSVILEALGYKDEWDFVEPDQARSPQI